MSKTKGAARSARKGEERLVFGRQPKTTEQHVEEAKGLFASELAHHVYTKTLEAKDKTIAALQRDRADLIRMLASFSASPLAPTATAELHWAPVNRTGD